MPDRFKNAPLSQQIATLAAALCLVVSLALVILGAISSKHLQQQQQLEFGNALAHQIARRVGVALEAGDLLSITASLQRYVETSSAEEITIFDVEGKALGEAGQASGNQLTSYRAPVRIESDVAGEVLVTVNTASATAAHQRFVLSLLGLAVLLSLAVYGAGLQLGKRLGARIGKLSQALSLEDAGAEQNRGNELAVLESRVSSLPMDLLRASNDTEAREENYRSTAVLYLHLESLVDYVDTLDDQSLHRYTDRLHQVVYASAGFYGGELQVSRQFALAVYFSGPSKAGSAAFRAASCAWLVQAVSRELEQTMPLSMKIAMAMSQSELGVGDGKDIYPGLYMQSTLDELQAACAAAGDRILLAPAIADDVDINGRVEQRPEAWASYSALGAFAGQYQDLLERQLRLILKRLQELV